MFWCYRSSWPGFRCRLSLRHQAHDVVGPCRSDCLSEILVVIAATFGGRVVLVVVGKAGLSSALVVRAVDVIAVVLVMVEQLAMLLFLGLESAVCAS